METKEITLPEGWEFDKCENGKIILKESAKFPSTWGECYKKLKEGEYIINGRVKSVLSGTDNRTISEENFDVVPKGLGKPMLTLMKLLVCRDAYRQGWKPDWKDCTDKYIIVFNDGKIERSYTIYASRVLSFQSAEVRDKFYENFKDLIEEAKEFL